MIVRIRFAIASLCVGVVCLLNAAPAFAQSGDKAKVFEVNPNGTLASQYGVMEGEKLSLANGSHFLRVNSLEFDADKQTATMKYTMYDMRASNDPKLWVTVGGGRLTMLGKTIVYNPDKSKIISGEMEIQGLWILVGQQTVERVEPIMKLRMFPEK